MTATKTRNRFQGDDIRAFIRQNSFVASAASRTEGIHRLPRQDWIGLIITPFPIHSQRVNCDYAGGTRALFMARGHYVFYENRKYEVNFRAEILVCHSSGRDRADF